ncbi:MAG TPA: prepilin-type N-terminal cleavage/methylation domain-containing protein [Kiritimatiellia bacterium]|nr:prepilin-type N-terminal cleavage/methylation domain-containing protein [Kiritimatiellia bacterium]
MKNKKHNREGFSLVEVALALMVTSLGMMAVFSLFPAGMSMNKRAIDDTQLSLFADDLFNGLRTAVWHENWSTLNPNNIRVTPTATSVWHTAGGRLPAKIGVGEGVLIYEFAEYPVVDLALNYKLDAGFVDNATRNRIYFRLELWNGEFKPANNVPPQLFYTEVYASDLRWR